MLPVVVTVERSRFDWPVGYFTALKGCRVAFTIDARGLYGTLDEVVETAETITLTLSDPRREG